MKKAVLLFVLCLSFATTVKAQTWWYKYLYTVDKQTGMKKNPGNGSGGMYITFTNEKRHCYQSNKDGTLWKPENNLYASAYDDQVSVYNFVGTQNNMHVYRQTSIRMTYMGNVGGWGTYTFSTDFSRLNYNTTITSSFANEVRVYERSSPEERRIAPDQLY